jgi:CRISPR-associated protein Csb1
MSEAMTHEQLHAAVAGNASAFRIITRLAPVGGDGDKVFPPTYEGSRYATEKRNIAGQSVETVLLDSVQSQANRLEQALLSAFRAGRCNIPLLTVKIPRGDSETTVTALDAPHRVWDAIFRDSRWGGVEFRKSPNGQRLVKARPESATPFYQFCPTALLFGMWDSTGGGGGVNSLKLARALVSEIVGLHASYGRRTSSRIDPLAISSKAATIFKSENGMWTLREDAAAKEKDRKGNAVPVKYKSGRPSEINHGNVTPTISEGGEPRDVSFQDVTETDADRFSHRFSLSFRKPEPKTDKDRPASGGATISEALQTTVLSFPQLRRLRFPADGKDKPNPERDVAGRTVLAALALYAVALSREDGYFLRSRCHLLPLEPSRNELLGATAQEVELFSFTPESAQQVFEQAVKQAEKVGLKWDSGEIELTPSEDLVELVRRSDEKVQTEGGDADAGA